ncbi:pre protein translocase YidC subunit [Exophiala viscosa]|uniref:Pre protein translocase YidC subunit n=1 Tax=Exophiala viscosa TaxID=2486360 RepID=A0AAN6E0E0_9EURO|nr:pre protein translocase YidC subunit [Exophiala viscosa]
MPMSQGLRWSGRHISNGNWRLTGVGARDVRHFSHHTSRASLTRARATWSNNNARLVLSQQSRSISLFGWGSDKPSATEAVSPPETLQSTIEPPQTFLEPTRTVKASHATAEAPDPTFTHPHPVSSVEPQALADLENAILKPHGTPPSPELATDVASVPEGIGYLKDVCGLDFGWGPTAIMEYFYEHLHVTAGLSWSSSIIALAVLTRIFLFPAAVGAAEQGARMKLMQPVLQPLRAKVAEALRENNRQVAIETQQQIRELSKGSGVSLSKAFLPIIIQIPLQFGAFRLLRDCGTLPVPAFETEQWLWVQNLSVGDSTYLLPLGAAAMTYFNISASAKGNSAAPPAMQMLRLILPPISFVFLLFQPGATQLYFFVNGILSQLQITTIQNPWFRKWRNMTPIAPSTPGSGPAPKSTKFSKMNIIEQPVVQKTVASRSVIATPESVSSSDRSIIDKGVEVMKAQGSKVWKSATSGVSNTWKTETEKRVEKAKIEKKQTSAAKYEAQRRLDIEQERAYRNAAATSKR